ncbi:unnamed protein product [Taenia asiatica]|uniref:Hexosyltransferase n=1 Tax=Taenia asiatica TaxID=60517 RepID=A0A0R3WB53_TAEAS|nr:unnamed protein product [Taenia asiatica]
MESGKWVSFKEIGSYNRSIWRLAIYPNVWRTYPQDVPTKKMPNYNFPIHILKTSNSVCSGNIKHDLVIVVKSGIFGWDKRDQFRAFVQRQKDLNPNTKLGVVFSIGMPRKHGGRMFNRDGHTTVLRGPVGDMMDAYIGRDNEVMQKIEEEMKKYDDIVLADYEDTYYNLTWKTITNLRWISAFCDKLRNDMFVIIDDDHRVNVSMLMRFLALIPRHIKRTSIFGRIAKYDGAFRSPLSADIVDDMAVGSAYTRYNYVHEDVYLGLLAFKLGIPLYNIYTMFDHQEYERRWPPNSSFMVAESKYWNMI